VSPTKNPTRQPTVSPTSGPTLSPTAKPTAEPTVVPTEAPTTRPTLPPTMPPTALPTFVPTAIPTGMPTGSPSDTPTQTVTDAPTVTAEPTISPETIDILIAADDRIKLRRIEQQVEATAEAVLLGQVAPTAVADTGAGAETETGAAGAETETGAAGAETETGAAGAETETGAAGAETETGAAAAETEPAAAERTDTVPVGNVGVRRKRNLEEWTTYLRRSVQQATDADIPTNCEIVSRAVTADRDCVEIGSKLSYKCEKDNIRVCCKKKKPTFQLNGGDCKRNPTPPANEFNPTVYSVVADATRAECDSFPNSVPAGKQCIQVVMTVGGPDRNDLYSYKNSIEASVDDGSFEQEIVASGLDAAVDIIPITESPTPGPTNSPTTPAPTLLTESPTSFPTLSPTQFDDPCPLLTTNCVGCVANDLCLWCPSNGSCMSTRDVRNTDVCPGTPSASLLVCATAAPTLPRLASTAPRPTAEPTVPPVSTATPTDTPTVKTSGESNQSPDNPSGAWSSFSAPTRMANALCTGAVSVALLFFLAAP